MGTYCVTIAPKNSATQRKLLAAVELTLLTSAPMDRVKMMPNVCKIRQSSLHHHNFLVFLFICFIESNKEQSYS